MKASPTADGGVFASLKKEHTPGPEVRLVTTAAGLTFTAFVCLRCRLVYVPEEICDGEKQSG